MAVPKPIIKLVGSWKGSSRLNLSWLPEGEQIKVSTSSMQVKTDKGSNYATITYTWVYENESQSGTLIIAASESGTASCGWSDSWHQNSGVLALTGSTTDDGNTGVTGSYGDGQGGPDWGWRIEIAPTNEQNLSFRMFNIDPDGIETWAVEAVYQRDA